MEVIPRRAFIVCGAESSGNRLLAAILVRAGCWGQSSTDQPAVADVPDTEPLVVIIRHRDLKETHDSLQQKGFRVTGVMPVREWNANIKSMVSRGHVSVAADAELCIKRVLYRNLSDSLVYDIPLIVTTYESLQDQAAVAALLRLLDLPANKLDQPLSLRGQEYPDQTFQPKPIKANAKHYAGNRDV